MLEDIAGVVEEKANEIFEQALEEFAKEKPGVNVDDEVRQIAKQRATSQLMFSLGNIIFPENADENERIESWYTNSLKAGIISSCKRCLSEETEKRAASADDGLSDIDRYLRKHGMGFDK